MIDEQEANLFNIHIMSNSELKSGVIEAGDRICQTRFHNLSDRMQTCLDVEPAFVVTQTQKMFILRR